MIIQEIETLLQSINSEDKILFKENVLKQIPPLPSILFSLKQLNQTGIQFFCDPKRTREPDSQKWIFQLIELRKEIVIPSVLLGLPFKEIELPIFQNENFEKKIEEKENLKEKKVQKEKARKKAQQKRKKEKETQQEETQKEETQSS